MGETTIVDDAFRKGSQQAETRSDALVFFGATGDLTSRKLIPALAAAIELIDPLSFVAPVKSILLLIIQYLLCFTSTMEGLLATQASIDLSIAEGNPDLLASLTCASDNVNASMSAVLQSLGPLGPLLQTVQPLISIASSAGVSFPVLTIPDLSGAQDMEQTLKTLSQTLTDAQQVISAIPV